MKNNGSPYAREENLLVEIAVRIIDKMNPQS
jgi:hypothetical protein